MSYTPEFCSDVAMVLARSANAFCRQCAHEDDSRNVSGASLSKETLSVAYERFLAAPER